jgi:cell division protein FtsX
MGDNYNRNEQENKDLVKELEQIKKRQKFLKIMTYILLFIVIASFSVFYIIYSNYKKIQNSIESAIENPQMQEKLNDFASKMVEYSSAIAVSTVNQPSSLSMIVFSSRSFDMSEDKKKEIENLASEVENDPELNKFIDTFKNEPEFKEIL